MRIEKAKLSELPIIMQIYRDAAEFMRETGNPDQWKDGYPSLRLIEDDIARELLYVAKEDERIVAVFYSEFGEDATYKKIYSGAWHTDAPYGIIHRIAVEKGSHGKGIVAFCFGQMLEKWGSIRIDTHKDNLPMQRALGKFGFRPAGTIYLENGEERIAFDIKNN